MDAAERGFEGMDQTPLDRVSIDGGRLHVTLFA